MIKQGKVPPNVKTDVDDSVKDPNAPLEAGSLSKPTKPWQTSAQTSEPLSFKVHELDDDLARPIGPQSNSDDDEAELS